MNRQLYEKLVELQINVRYVADISFRKRILDDFEHSSRAKSDKRARTKNGKDNIFKYSSLFLLRLAFEKKFSSFGLLLQLFLFSLFLSGLFSKFMRL